MPMQIQSLVRRTVTPSRLLCLPDGVRSSSSPTNSISKVLNPHHGAWSWSKDVRMSVPLSHVYGRVLTSDQKWCTLRTRVGARIAVGTAESALPASARYTQLRAKRNDAFVTQSSLPQVHPAICTAHNASSAHGLQCTKSHTLGPDPGIRHPPCPNTGTPPATITYRHLHDTLSHRTRAFDSARG